MCFFKVNVLTMVMIFYSSMFIFLNLSINGSACFLASSVHFFDNWQWQCVFL
jgi:hypothetical protein